MSNIQELHNDAMNIAEEAFVAKLQGNTEEAQTLFRRAFEKERAAANLLAKDIKFEPSRSVIHRSAASLAIDCGELREAERLIATALSGDPPSEIADELRILLEQIFFQRNLEMRGITLAEDEFQLSIAGRAIGYGMALSEQFVSRVQTLEKLLFRTGERLAKKPFREKGPPKKLLREGLDLFVSAPKAGSFVVNFKMGYPKEQQVLPGLDYSAAVIDELFESLKVFNESTESELIRRIPEETYYVNFVALVRAMAPDGDQVKQVALTAMRRGVPRSISLTRQQEDISLVSRIESSKKSQEVIRVEGRIRYADSTKDEAEGQIRLVDEKGNKHRILVPVGMMNDIVRPHWDYTVVVEGIKIGNIIHLQDIKRTTD